MMPVSAGTRTQPGSMRDVLGANWPQGQAHPDVASVPRSDAATSATVVGLLRKLGDLHGQMLNQFQQSLGLMVRLFACLGREQLPAMQRELVRIQELNSELSHLQVELARRRRSTRGSDTTATCCSNDQRPDPRAGFHFPPRLGRGPHRHSSARTPGPVAVARRIVCRGGNARPVMFGGNDRAIATCFRSVSRMPRDTSRGLLNDLLGQ